MVNGTPLVQFGQQFKRQLVHVNDVRFNAQLFSMFYPAVTSQPDAAALDDSPEGRVFV